jgi:diguanylate cyclase (GGDEF)-like protein
LASRRIRSIQYRLLRAVVAATVLVVGVRVVTLLAIRSVLRKEVKRELVSSARAQRVHVDMEVGALHDKVLVLASDSALAGILNAAAPRASVSNHLSELSRRSPFIWAITLCTPDGETIGDSAGAGADHIPSAIPSDFKAAAKAQVLATGKPIASKAFGVGGKGRYFDAVPVYGPSGSLGAVFFAEVSMDSIDTVVTTDHADRRSLDSHLVQKIGADAEFVTDLRFKPSSRFSFHLPLASTRLPAVRAALGESGLIENSRDYRNKKVVAYVEPLKNAPWSLVVKVDESDAYSIVGKVGWILTSSLLGSLVVLAAAYRFLSRSLVGRIHRLTASATAISRGALATRVSDPSDDELGQLGRAFDRMADTLARDIARRERVEGQLAHRALHDFLTDLPNRSHFTDLLHRAIERRQSTGEALAVLFVDLDEFKSVNDELGHSAGDALLRSVADRFRHVVSGKEALARFGGDEFVVLCTGLTAPNDASVVADRLLESLRAPIRVADVDVFVTASIGIAVVDDKASPESLVRDADAAMYRAKKQGRGRRVTHDAARPSTVSPLAAMTDLRRAIDSNAFAMVFQPIVEMRTGKLLGYEALARWPRPDGVVMPEDFVPLVSQLDLTAELDQWAVLTACKALPTLQANGPVSTLFVSVNVSTPTLLLPGFAERIVADVHSLYRTGRSLCLEITEQELAEVTAPALSVLEKLRAAGVRVSIDDFGTGASSLSRLRQLPVDILKIDKQFVEDIDTDSGARSMCGAVVAMGNDLGLRVVAEGVERPEQVAVLLDIGCYVGQGYLFGRPADASVVPTGASGR